MAPQMDQPGAVMTLSRRALLELAAGAAIATPCAQIGWTQDYPARLVRLIVGFPPGSSADIVARLMGQWLAERLSQPVVVENRPGAASNIAAEAVIRSPPDGYSLFWATSANAISESFYDNLKFSFSRDVTPIAGVMSTPMVMVVAPAFPAKTVPEFIAYAKANPRKINMASGGNGGTPHVTGELFKMMAGVDMTHVPYRGDAPAMTDLIGGQVDVLFGILSLSIEHIRAGRVRALAVTTASRSPALPGVPTMGEFVPGYEVRLWHGLVAPQNTPAPIVDRLNREVNAGLSDAGLKARLADIGAVPMPMTAVDFGKFVANDAEKWGRVVKFSGAKAE
jgi:tripartite-type tricarboxylate transporter receptor subunit TctC